MNNNISFKEFKNKINEVLLTQKHLKKENFYYEQTMDAYYAAYHPKYPERTAADFLVSYNHFTEKSMLSADTACIPIVKKYDSLDQLIADNFKED